MKKIFGWLRSKPNGNEGSNTSNPHPKSYHQPCKEEFSDWPNALLAIGTFGNKNNLKHSESGDEADNNTSAQVLEEVDKELRRLLNSKHITVEQLLECLLRRDGDGAGNGHLERKSSLVQRGKKDIHSDNRGTGISKKSLSLLIKKALLCGGAAPPPPIFRDPLPDPKSDLSRMEKILRAMLHKKIYPQRPTPKKYLDMGESESEEEGNHSSKWVKTDSEYIVLEI